MPIPIPMSMSMSMSMSFVKRYLLSLPCFLALSLVPILLTGCVLGPQAQLVSIKAGLVERVVLYCEDESDADRQSRRKKAFWVTITDGEGTLRAKYRVLEKKHQGSVLVEGLTPDTVPLKPGGSYVVEVTHPVSETLHKTDIRRVLIPVVGGVLSPTRVLAGFSVDQQPVYEDVLRNRYIYKKGGKVVFTGKGARLCK